MEAIILRGLPASGKTTFYTSRYLHTHVRISQDLLRTRHRLERFLELCLDTRQPFVVDRVNATPEERRRFVAPAIAANFRVVAIMFDAPAGEALRRNGLRSGRARVPAPAILGTAKHLVPPRADEGFDDIVHVTSDGAGRFVTSR